jgi:hypothetical protein
MGKNLFSKVGEITLDNLIVDPYPRALTYGISIVGGEGELARGTVLALTDDNNYVVLGADNTGKANCILCEPVSIGEDESVTAVAYRTGHFNRNALIVAEGYALTFEDEENLRKCGILLSDMI